MLYLFILSVIFYALIGFKAFHLKDLKGELFWARMIFLCSLISVIVAYGLILSRVPESICNVILILGFLPGIIFSFKFFRINLYKFQPVSMVHVVYLWGAVSIVATLVLELLPIPGANFRKSEWSFSTGLLVGIILVIVLFLPKKTNTFNS